MSRVDDLADRIVAGIQAAVNPTPVDVWGPLGYTPNPKQTELHHVPPFSDGGPWDVLYGGAMGGGKTYSLLFDALQKAADHPGIEIWLVRDTFPSLEEGFITELEKIGFAQDVGARWNGTQRILRMPNGSRLSFKHARNMVDASTTRGQCQYLIVDERSHIDPEVVDHLSLRVRSGDPKLPVIGIRSGTNPGNVGHGRLKEMFIDPAPLGHQRLPILDKHKQPITLKDGRLLEAFFLPATMDDNPHLDDDYGARFSGMTDDVLRAYRDGDWSGFPGMRFDRFSTGLHVVKPFAFSIAERRGVGVDRGSSSPFAAVWGALVDDQVVIYREQHTEGLTPTEQAKLIRSSERDDERSPGTRAVPVWLDPECWHRSPDMPLAKPMPGMPPAGSIAHSYTVAGLPVERADNRRVDGWSRVDELLSVDGNGRPRMVIFDTCPNVIRSLSNAPRDKRDPEDVAGDYRDDHAADALRYLVMGLAGRLVGERAQPRRHRNGDRVGALTGGVRRMGF